MNQIMREVKIKPIYECRCDERLQTKNKIFLPYTLRLVVPQKRKDSKRKEESSAAVPQTKGRVGKEERVHLSTIENPYRGNRSPLL
jgi:hypothetical protein